MRGVTWFGFAVYLLLGWTSVLIPSLIVEIQGAFDRSDADIGLAYLFGAVLYAGGALGGGFLAERLGARPMLLLALGILTASLVLQGWSTVWLLFLLAAALGQSGSGAADGGVQAVFLEIFPQGRGGALNHLHLFYGLGALLGPAAVGLVVTTEVSWRAIFLGSGAPLLALTAVAMTLPAGHGRAQQVELGPETRTISARELSLRPFIWLAVSIACYEAAAIGTANWLVRFLSNESIRVATGALSLWWAGVCLSRLVAPWVTRRVPARRLALACILGSSITLAAAVLVPSTVVAIGLFALSGYALGPIYPLLIAIGGDLYPRHLATLSGGLTTAATLGAIFYPPLMGFVADSIGIRIGLFGAAVLGLPAAIALIAATRLRTVSGSVAS